MRASAAVQKYRLALKREQRVQLGRRVSGSAAPRMHYGHDSSPLSHALGSGDQVCVWLAGCTASRRWHQRSITPCK